MAVGFGFSVSDICNAFKLLKASIQSLDERHGAVSQYAGLLSEIDLLQDGMQEIEELSLDESLPRDQYQALQRAVDACQSSINGFIEATAKYQPHLTGIKSHSISTKLRKVQWALCQKDDVERFRKELERHISSINMLLLTLQTKRDQQSQAVTRQHDNDTYGQLNGLMKNMTMEQRQFFSMIFQQNQELLRSVQDLRRILDTQRMIPPQILLQQPVILLDPLGKVVPFHLEFIDSLDCFTTVLRSRFAKAGISASGLLKLADEEYYIEDTDRKRPIDVSRDWSSVFRPGQRVDMRMRYHRFACRQNTCPACLETNDDGDEDAYCLSCGLAYQNFRGISKQSPEWLDWGPHLLGRPDMVLEGEQIPYILFHPRRTPELKAFNPPEEDEGRWLDGYRRIQVVSQPYDLLDPLFPGLKLVQDFVHFAEMLEDVPPQLNSYLPEILEIKAEAQKYLVERDTRPPAFSSFSQVTELRQALTKDSKLMRQKINSIFQSLCDDPDTPELIAYIKRRKPSNEARTSYYADVLNVMVNISKFAKSTNPKRRKPFSKEKVQWRLLDSGSTVKR